jgi:hypothetical protein
MGRNDFVMADRDNPDWIDHYHRPDEIARLVGGFETCSLPGERWTHRAHLVVALWYLTRCPIPEATEHIRGGIQRYNASRGLHQAYHETITRFYIWAVLRYLEGAGDGHSIVALANGLVNGPLGDKTFPLAYYSRERLMSPEARAGWIEPDLRPMD